MYQFKFTRWALAVIPAILILFGQVQPAAANPPTTETVVLDPFTIPTGVTACSFDVLVEPLSNKEKQTTFFDQAGNIRSIHISGGLKLRLTNVDTGKSVERNVSGPSTAKPQPDGSLLITTGGPTLYWFFDPGVAPNQPLLALFHGKTVAEFDAAGDFHFLEAKGKVEDLCAVLAN
jgi:hypothetical protein